MLIILDINWLKDIIIPLLTLLLAIIVFFSFVWQERKKLRLKTEEDIDTVSRSIYRDLLYLLEQWQLFGLEKKDNQVNPNRIILIREIYSRVKKNLFEKPEIFENYFRDIRIKTSDNKIFLLLGELEIDFLNDKLDYNYFVNYAIYKLLSYWENDPQKLGEIEKIIKDFEKSGDSRIKAIGSAL